jgi:hypothetical protein
MRLHVTMRAGDDVTVPGPLTFRRFGGAMWLYYEPWKLRINLSYVTAIEPVTDERDAITVEEAKDRIEKTEVFWQTRYEELRQTCRDLRQQAIHLKGLLRESGHPDFGEGGDHA